MNEGRLVILAGGIASRMKKPLSMKTKIEEYLIEDANKKAKSMIRVGRDGRPFLDYLLYNARETGYKDIVIVIGEKDNSIREYYGYKDFDNKFFGLKISYAIQPIPEGRTKPLGTGDALWRALVSRPDWKGKKFTVCNSDNLYSQRALKIVFNSNYPGALIDYNRDALEFDSSRIEKFAITIKNEDGFLLDIIEKPSTEIIQKVLRQDGYLGVSMNLFSLQYDLILPILENLEPNPERDEKELPEAVKLLAVNYKNSVYAYPLSEHVPDLTSKEDIPQVKQYLEKYYYNVTF